MSNFSFTRNPSVKVRTRTVLEGLSAIDNTLVIVGRMAAAGTTATALVPYTVENFGDSTAALAECSPLFGAASECTEMVVAAIKAVFESDMEPKFYPKIKVIPMANANTDLAAALAANISMPMPFIASAFPATDATRLGELRTHAEAISAEDRGRNGQFGSFAFAALDSTSGVATPVGIAAASKAIVIPWLRDGAVGKANKVHAVCAAVAAVCAANGQPYLPLNGTEIGGLVAPVAQADYHTDGDTGTCALGLAAGLVPLMINHRGRVSISRTVTSIRTKPELEDTAYYDMQDWQKLYSYRTDCYSRAQEPRYKKAHASDAKLRALNSELLQIAKRYETELEMFQHVDKFAPEFKVTRPSNNRHAGIFYTPVNVVPGFHNKGIDIAGTDKYDTFAL